MKRERITVKPQVKVDRLRDPEGAAAPEPFDVPRCKVWPRSSHEEGKGWITIDGFNVFTPPGYDIPASALIVLRGETWSVVGNPGVYDKGTLITLKRVGSA